MAAVLLPSSRRPLVHGAPHPHLVLDHPVRRGDLRVAGPGPGSGGIPPPLRVVPRQWQIRPIGIGSDSDDADDKIIIDHLHIQCVLYN